MSTLLLWLRRIGIGIAVFVVLVAVLIYALLIRPITGWPGSPHQGPPPKTPAWALECWVWEDDVNTGAFTRELLADYKKNDFPTRTILINSPWSTAYNTFEVDAERFPNPEPFFRDLEDDGYRVVLWMTNNVNRENKDTLLKETPGFFEEAASRGYLAAGGFSTGWWKGDGGFIDYTNPEAMAWWQNLQQDLFNWGIDGWKLDGTATFFRQPWFGVQLPFGESFGGTISMRTYMDHYYRDEYLHGLTQNPEFVTVSRARDSVIEWAHYEGYAPIDASPVNWVGDNTHTWGDTGDDDRGLERAVRVILRSADMGYNIIGSDIGGYHGGMPIPPKLYIRWAQFSTFCGLWLNGGHRERRMSERTQQELEVIREFAWLHTELVPYMYRFVISGHEGGRVLMQPWGDRHGYYFGDDIFVQPIVSPEDLVEVRLPEGSWRYWFNDFNVIEGPTTLAPEFTTRRYPVYVRDGAVIPMRIQRDYTGIGDETWADFITLNVFPNGESVYEFPDPETDRPYRVTVTESGSSVAIAVENAPRKVLLCVHLDEEPVLVTRGDETLAEGDTGWTWDAGSRTIVIKGEAPGTSFHTLRLP